jgi:hypothetical protein
MNHLKNELLKSHLTKLETSVEIISDMIAHKSNLLRAAVEAEDGALETELKSEINALAKEKSMCYDSSVNESIFTKAIGQYAPYLKVN